MYTFLLPNQETFCLTPLTEDEISEAHRLCDECVGENLYSEEELAATLDVSDQFFYLLKTTKGEIVGYIYYELTEIEHIANYARVGEEVYRAVYFKPKKKVGKIQSVGLKEKYRGLGIAAQMAECMLGEMKTRGIEITFIVCWKPKGSVPLGKMLSHCRFRYLTEAKKVWYDNLALKCPYCSGRCLCDAEVYYKML